MQKQLDLLRYENAAAVLPTRLRKAALLLPEHQKGTAEEFRLRVGRPLSVLLAEGEVLLEPVVESEELETLCDLASEFSRYAAAETLRDGFIPVRGGFRLGLCGTVVMKEGVPVNVKSFSSAVLRIAREQKGIAEPLLANLFRDERFRNTLILSGPGGGKTTLLRDLVRCLSIRGTRVALLDERGEVAAVHYGEPQLDVGPCTDVLDACPKALGIPMVLRAMNPQIIAVDEITAQEDLRAISLAAGCGVGLLATIHAGDVAELKERPLYQKLLEERVFRMMVRIRKIGGERSYMCEELP